MSVKVYKNWIAFDGVDGYGSSTLSKMLSLQLDNGLLIDVPAEGRNTDSYARMKDYTHKCGLTYKDTDPALNRFFFDITSEVFRDVVIPRLAHNEWVITVSGDIKNVMHSIADGNENIISDYLGVNSFLGAHKPGVRVFTSAPADILLKEMEVRVSLGKLDQSDPDAEIVAVRHRLDSFTKSLGKINNELNLGIKHIYIDNDRSKTPIFIATEIANKLVT